MKPWHALALGAALGALAALLREASAPVDSSSADAASDDGAPVDPGWLDELQVVSYEAKNLIMPTPAATMNPSDALRSMLKRREALRLTRYRLGDGGWTNGYGHYWPDGGPVPPETITREEAEAQFERDIEERGARWVRAYVTADVDQAQFDALVHMAFNLSPKSFKTIADAVNAGEDPEAAAMRYIRAGTNLENGLRARRAEELALYRFGIYA